MPTLVVTDVTDMHGTRLGADPYQFPDREIVGVNMRAAPTQCGAVHCVTQQMPSSD